MQRRFTHDVRISALGAALALAGLASAPAGAATLDQHRAVVLANRGAPIAARSGTPAQTIAAVLLARGRDAASMAALRTADSRAGMAGVTHVVLEQSVAGLPVYGAYAKGSFDASGALIHLIDHLSAVPAGGLAASRIDAAQALRVATARLHPTEKSAIRLASTQGNTSVFDGGAFFHEAPEVSAVAVPLSNGTMARGWLVETWTEKTNQLHHTLVGGDGQILRVELRTQSDSYNIYPIDPSKGPQVIVQGPGAGNTESPSGWLAGRVEKTTKITGNNVSAYLDTDDNNRADQGGTRATTSFLAAANLTQPPSTTTNKAVSVQNLFYLNNVLHDTLYKHGFTEAAGNFQADNFGKGGSGNDPVQAEAQDGGGLDNANFATPKDGRKPRMQMYLWSGAGPTHEVVITTPVNVTYNADGAQFGPPLTTTGLSKAIAVASPVDACSPVAASGVAGKIALVDRGTCAFTDKALAVQAAGAVGMIVANNTGGTAIFAMGGDATVAIPAVMISQNDGAALKALANPAGTIRAKAVQPLQIDGALDTDVVYHEYGHGLSWRLIGGMSGPLAGAIGEGSSDGLSMLINGSDIVGEYASSTPTGIRRFPYAGYPLTYADVNGAEPHDDGEIYAAVIWRLIELFGTGGRSKLFDYYVNGMNFTPSTPAYEDMRDGILQAVAVGPTPSDRCTIWSAFAQFGIGVGANGVVNPDGTTVTITPSFTKPSDCL